MSERFFNPKKIQFLIQGFEHAQDFLDWTLGVHGIRIEFHTERGSRRTATYLPQVASEQGTSQLNSHLNSPLTER